MTLAELLLVVFLTLALTYLRQQRQAQTYLALCLEELVTSTERALPFTQPRRDYAGRDEGSFSEQIRAALVREDLSELLNALPHLEDPVFSKT